MEMKCEETVTVAMLICHQNSRAYFKTTAKELMLSMKSQLIHVTLAI